MSDRDQPSDPLDPASPAAWRQGPAAYLAGRPPAFTAPALPASCYLTMRDGCRIAVDVYLPQGDAAHPAPARVPTIAIFTPYYRRFVTSDPTIEVSPNCGRYRDAFVPQGYAVVVVDVRGTGASFGTRDALRSPKERDDYEEIAEWISQQPWSDGSIGCTGISYLGAAAVFLASTRHPAVKAIAPLFAVTDIYTDQLYVGGVLSCIWTGRYDELMVALDQDDRPALAKFAYYGNPAFQGPQPVDEDPDGRLLAQALQQHRSNCRLSDMARELPFQHDAVLHDPALTLDVCSPGYYARQIPEDVAIYSISGWYDGAGYSNSAITRFLTLPNHQHRLLLGPWDHGARSNVSPWREQAASQFPLLAEVLRFFDHHLRGMDTGLQHEKPVHYFTQHDERWQAADAWPPFEGKVRLHPAADGGLSASAGAPGSDRLAVDFSVSTGTQTRLERLGAVGVEHYYPDWDARQAQYLHYTSPVLAASAELTGHVTASIELVSSETDAAVYVYLSEVLADGSCRYVTEGNLRALHREGLSDSPDYVASWPVNRYDRATARLLVPGEPARLLFALLPVSWTFAAGSRIRLSLGGSDQGHGPQVPHGRPPLLDIRRGPEASWFELPLAAPLSFVS
ncbi:CocE/NonD family hydrolase [Xylophilus rhododendri]|uniref:CocE/NonD family hydrolase n=1 Tax=Xylophilus rhododendri TaxID=2697032 RepID=A0A857J9T8_9BURK|nr:CocE/NonD family hydrolase [Xylophilus rhododendri]QHI99508.1 CocE/NonD family hydrolase [Xylophilus rhododendri]